MHIWRTNTENVFIYLHCATILGKMHFCGNTSNAINCCFLEIYLELSLSCSSQNKGKIRDFLLRSGISKPLQISKGIFRHAVCNARAKLNWSKNSIELKSITILLFMFWNKNTLFLSARDLTEKQFMVFNETLDSKAIFDDIWLIMMKYCLSDVEFDFYQC